MGGVGGIYLFVTCLHLKIVRLYKFFVPCYYKKRVHTDNFTVGWKWQRNRKGRCCFYQMNKMECDMNIGIICDYDCHFSIITSYKDIKYIFDYLLTRWDFGFGPLLFVHSFGLVDPSSAVMKGQIECWTTMWKYLKIL